MTMPEPDPNRPPLPVGAVAPDRLSGGASAAGREPTTTTWAGGSVSPQTTVCGRRLVVQRVGPCRWAHSSRPSAEAVHSPIEGICPQDYRVTPSLPSALRDVVWWCTGINGRRNRRIV